MFRADSLVAGGPRCWVGHIDGASDEVGLKDSWIDFTRNSEPTIVINQLKSGPYPNLPPVLRHGVAPISYRGKSDSEPDAMLKVYQCGEHFEYRPDSVIRICDNGASTTVLKSPDPLLPTVPTVGRGDSHASAVPLPSDSEAAKIDREFRHYRVILEVGTPLDKLETLSDVFKVLLDGTKGACPASATWILHACSI